MAFSREFRILLAEILLVSFIVGPVLAADYVETFQDDTPPNTPTADWYDFSFSGQGTARVSSAITSISTNTLLFEDNSATGAPAALFDASVADADLCDDGVLAFQHYIVDYPGIATRLRVATSTGADVMRFEYDATGIVSIQADGTTVITPITLGLNTWYNITITMTGSCIAGSPQSATVYVAEFDASATASDPSMSACGDCVGDSLEISDVSAAASLSKSYFDNLEFRNVPDQGVEAVALVTVNNLVGFDVDPSGTAIITREDFDDIATYQATGIGTLDQVATRDTDCNDEGDMVAASGIAIVYVVCSVLGEPAFFSIRDFSDNVLDFPGDCSPDDDCLDDIDIDSGDCASFDDDNDLKEIHDLVVIPLDYSYITEDQAILDDSRAFAVAYSTVDGYVGVFEYTTNQGDDACNEERELFSAGQAVRQISVWRPDDDSDNILIGAVGYGTPTRIYRYDPDTVTGVGDGPQELDGTLTLERSFVSSGTGISCHLHYCLVSHETGSGDRVRLIDSNTGTDVWGPILGGGQIKGVSLSPPEDDTTPLTDLFAAWCDTSCHIGWASNGTTFGLLEYPAANFFDVELGPGANDCWIATQTQVGYYDCEIEFDAITGVCLSGCGPADVPGDSSLFGGGSQRLVETGTFANIGLANMFMGVLMVAGMTVTLGFSPQVVTKGRAEFNSRLFLVLGVIGAVLGFVLAIAFGLFSTAVWVSVVVLAAIAVGVRIWLRSRGE